MNLNTRSALLIATLAAVPAAAQGTTAAEAEFKRFDADGSGYLSRAEMAACGCQAYDANGDQILVLAEFLKGRGAVPHAPSPVPHQGPHTRTVDEFRRYDTDGSGYLSRREMEACRCASFDANGDQILTEAEYTKVPAGANPAPTPRPSPARSGPVGTLGTPPPGRTPAPVGGGSAGGLRVGDRVKAGCYGNMKEGVVERFEGGRAYVRFDEERGCDGLRDVADLRPADRVSGTRGGRYAVGEPVEVLSLGRWHKAVVRGVRDGQYLVHYENYAAEADEWVDASRVRQTTERSGERTGSGGDLPAGKYECYNFSGGQLRYQTEFTVTGRGTYVGVDGSRGTFTIEGGLVRFQGGAFGGTQGEFEFNGGRPFVYMHTPSKPGTRAGMDCEGPKG